MDFLTVLHIHPLPYGKQINLKSALAHRKVYILYLVMLWDTSEKYNKSVCHRTPVLFC